MKRFALVVVLALLAIASVFAAPGMQLAKAEAKVSLTLKNEMFAEEKIGFTFSQDDSFTLNEDMTVLPKDVDRNINVNYANGKATSEYFGVYYKVKGGKPIKLTIGSDLNFTNTKDKSKKIGFSLSVTDGNSTSAIQNATDGWSKTIDLSATHIYEAGLLPISIVAENINASYISDAAYETLIVLQVTSAA